VRLRDVPRLTTETYLPRAYTPLIDACVEAIKTTEELVALAQGSPRVVVVFQTDGEENASRQHQLADLVDLTKRRTAEGWQFIYLGANIDAYKTARTFGITDAATVAYFAEETPFIMRRVAAHTGGFHEGAVAGGAVLGGRQTRGRRSVRPRGSGCAGAER